MPVSSPRSSFKGSLGIAPDIADERERSRIIVEAIQRLLDGKIKAIGTITLTINVASTTLSDIRIGRDTIVALFATTANAAAEIGAGTLYQTYPNANVEAAVLNHANNAQADRTFAYALLG